ncbi:MAG: hypothetical protein ACR2JB_00650 [Bryobacteraceae bacterium]
MRAHETYSLDCHACGTAVEFPVDGDTCCPRCGSALNIQWRGEPVEHPAIEYPDAAADEIAQTPSEEAQKSTADLAMATAIHTPLDDAAQLLAQETLDKLRAKGREADTT